jgi:hypothetical protein
MTSIRQLLEEKRRKRITPPQKKSKGTNGFIFIFLTDGCVCPMDPHIIGSSLENRSSLTFFSFFLFCFVQLKFSISRRVCVCPDVLNKSRRHHTTIVGYRNLSTFFFIYFFLNIQVNCFAIGPIGDCFR